MTVSSNPNGLFKRETKGRVISPATVKAERGRIRFFAQVLGEMDPIHLNVQAARAAGHPDLVAPPSYFVVLEEDANVQRALQGETSVLDLVGSDFRRLLHGEEHYSYQGLIYAGDEVSISTEVVDFYDKSGGAMEFVVLESSVVHEVRGLLLRARRTLLHRLG